MDTSFDVCVFILCPRSRQLNHSDTESTEWFLSPYFVGQTSVLLNESHEWCGNCQDQVIEDAVIVGFLHLNDMISAAGNLIPTEENDAEVHDYLRDHILWKVCKANGEVVSVSSIPSLKVTVYSALSSLPDWSRYFPFPLRRC